MKSGKADESSGILDIPSTPCKTDDSEELGTGDSASYRADVAHAIVNIGKGEALVFLVDIYR